MSAQPTLISGGLVPPDGRPKVLVSEEPIPRFKVAPGDFKHIYDKCPRCWHEKVHGSKVHKPVFPQVFRQIDEAMKMSLGVEAVRLLGIPAESTMQFGFLHSQPYLAAGGRAEIVIGGFLDKAFVLEDGSVAIVEFKTSGTATPDDYSRQIHGYDRAIEFPSKGRAFRVSRHDLVIFNPLKFGFNEKVSQGGMTGPIEHHSSPINRPRFLEFLDELAEAYLAPMPESGSGCQFCAAVEGRVRKLVN